MPVFDTYASRVRRAEKAGQPDVYQYDDLPPFLRRQINVVFTACIGPGACWHEFSSQPPNANRHWDAIAEILDREFESFHQQRGQISHDRVRDYIDTSTDLLGVLSAIEIGCRVIRQRRDWREYQLCEVGARQGANDGLEEINARFRNAGVGYQFEVSEILRVDSQYVHTEIVKPALELLAAPEFTQANQEFRLAHEHYRTGKLRDCNTAALRCMETVLKVICDARGWTHDNGATIEKLIAVVRANGLFPDYLGGYFDNLIGAMKAGVPKIRDRAGGHGAAPSEMPVPEHIAGFALHLAASNIVMLVQAHRSLPAVPRS